MHPYDILVSCFRLWVIGFFALIFAAGCATRATSPAAVAAKHGLVQTELQGTVFTHTAYHTPASSQSHDSSQPLLWVFIDGDGRPWINGGREPAENPTTTRPLALELAAQMQRPVLYVGRPCYDRKTMESVCTFTWWTDARYSSTVVESMVAAIRRYQEESHFERLVLVGYSGGGVLAELVAHELCGVTAVVTIAANLAVGLVAALHLYFLVLEMFLWDKPLGLRTFRMTPEYAKASKTLAANQGLYNGFLVAGLAWGLALGAAGDPIKMFFLGCVIVAGVFGALTVSRRILWVQALPGALALILVWLS